MTNANQVHRAQALLRKGEQDIPQSVQGVVHFISARGIWFKLSRNTAATSCLEAAQRRSRLGKIGIPIWDEMKSAVYRFVNAAGDDDYVAVHCRGDRMVNEESVKAFFSLESEFQRVEKSELDEKFGMAYGLVHPFSETLNASAVHLFDEDLVRRIGVPGTSMTNAGHVEWGIEFVVEELAKQLDRVQVAPISMPDPKANRRVWGVRDQKQIAIITGNAPESGMLLWELVNEYVRTYLGASCSGDVSMPPVTVFSIPEMGLSMELEDRLGQTWEGIRRTVTRACVGGCRILALACNTTQYFRPQIQAICDKWNVDFIFLPEVLEQYLRLSGVSRMRLLGIGYVTDMTNWSPFRDMRSVEVLPFGDADAKMIEHVAFAVKRGEDPETNIQKLRELLARPDEGRAKSKALLPMVIALTELSIILREVGIWKDRFAMEAVFGERRMIDTLPVYGAAIAASFLGVEFREMVTKLTRAL